MSHSRSYSYGQPANNYQNQINYSASPPYDQHQHTAPAFYGAPQPGTQPVSPSAQYMHSASPDSHRMASGHYPPQASVPSPGSISHHQMRHAPQNPGFHSQNQFTGPPQQHQRHASHDNHRHVSQTSQSQHFIFTPSQMAQSYPSAPNSNLMIAPQLHHQSYQASPHQSHSHASSPFYPPPAYSPPVASSSRGAHEYPARISTSQPPNIPMSGSLSPTSPHGERFPCEKCEKTFSRAHDRKRHYETQHLPTPTVHRCKYCMKEFSRHDSLKRHLDNGCDEMHT